MALTTIGHFILTLVLSLSIASCKKGETPTDNETKTLENQIKNKFFDEISPAVTLSCFQGAYYRKAVSSVDNWLGVEGKVILPTLIYDLSRVNPLKPGTYLDNASIYLGGTSDGQETDIGLTWEIIKDANGNISTERKAYRPFMRRTSHKSGQQAIYLNAPAESKYYWYPGDTITMGIVLTDPGRLLFTVSGAGKKFEAFFDVAGYQYTLKAQYKRVNAIDQVSNEGKPVQSTSAKVLGAKWLDASLYRYYKSEALKVPFHSKRYSDMRCPDGSHFEISIPSDNQSAETINIFGTK
jgi:hypothetical protein